LTCTSCSVPVPVHELFDSETWESSDVVRERVTRAREIQLGRQVRNIVHAACNAALSAADLEAVARPDGQAVSLLSAAIAKLGLSARAYGKVLRLARTLADLEAAPSVRSAHVAEAIGLRVYDRGLASSGRA
jgi:magnesium chelatase family protein